MVIKPKLFMNLSIPIGLLIIGLSGVDAWADGDDVVYGSSHFRSLVQQINQYSAQVNAHYGQPATAAPRTSAREASALSTALEERVLISDTCHGHRLIPATIVANVIRILDDCDYRLGHWPKEQKGFYQDYRIPDAIELPPPGGLPQLLEVVETHFGMRGRHNGATNTIDFTYAGIPHAQ